MRTIPSAYENMLQNPKQTRDNNIVLEPNVWIFRQISPLEESRFLEGQSLGVDNVTAVDIAVRHKRLNRESDTIYVAYISNGIARYMYADYEFRMSDHYWCIGDMQLEADDISITFDGTMPKNTSKNVEFVTEENMWVFWTKDGVCSGKQLNSNRMIDILADQNCTKVEALKATISEAGGFDFGLCVFMVVNGQLYYRQFIDGSWCDAEYISRFSNYTVVDVAASRTWDYRINLQVLDSDGNIHELFSQYQGIAKQNTDHIGAYITVRTDLLPINYINNVNTEHIEAEISASTVLYIVGVVTTQSVHNESVEGNYGKKLILTVNKDLTAESVANSSSEWTMLDSNGDDFYPRSVSLGEDNRTITLNFTNFNSAVGQCSISYSGSTILFPAGIAINSIAAFNFTPDNLDPYTYPPPLVTGISTPASNGTEIELTFNQPITTVNIGENANKFTITMDEYDYDYPGRTLHTVNRTVSNVSLRSPNVVLLSFTGGNNSSVQNAETFIRIVYEDGTLMGDGGDVRNFNMTCVPSGMTKNLGKLFTEHIDADISVESTLSEIVYNDGFSNEHINADISVTGTLTNICDL